MNEDEIWKDLSRRRKGLEGTEAFCRLRWPAFAPPSAIMVLDDPCDENSPQQPYMFTATTVPDAPDAGALELALTLHPVAAELLTDPPVAEITVNMGRLNEVTDWWLVTHGRLANEWYTPPPAPASSGVCACATCGGDPVRAAMGRVPLPPPHELRVIAGGGEGCAFVTVGDFVAQVGPWLRDIRVDLAVATGGMEDLGEDWDFETPGPEGSGRVWVAPPSVAVVELAEERGSNYGVLEPEEAWKHAAEYARLCRRFTASPKLVIDGIVMIPNCRLAKKKTG